MILYSLAQKTTHTLPPRALIGRTHRCDLQLTRTWVSGEHAAIRWSGARWEVRDLGSRNGTRLNEAALEVGSWQPLREGDVIVFGLRETTFRVLSVTPPALFAAAQHDDSIVLAEGGMLMLPDAEAPLVMVAQGQDGRWFVEGDTESRPVSPGELVQVGEAVYRIHLPEESAGTTEAHTQTHISDLRLDFAVSGDEEYVHLTAHAPRGALDLEARVHHYLLLTLARIRIRETGDGIRDAEAGWVYIEDLARMLRLTMTQINMAVFRARKQLAAAGVDGAAGLVERRPSTRQIRIGCARLDVRAL